MTDTETIKAAIEGTGLSVFVDAESHWPDNFFSFRQIDAGFTTELALGVFNFEESLAFIKGWKAAKGLPNRIKVEDLVFKMA